MFQYVVYPPIAAPVCCSVVAIFCSVLQYVSVCFSMLYNSKRLSCVLRRCCSIFLRVAVFCSMFVVCCIVYPPTAAPVSKKTKTKKANKKTERMIAMQCECSVVAACCGVVAVCCIRLHWVAMRWSVLECVAVCWERVKVCVRV